MKIKKIATAGTMESSDIHITIEPSEESGIKIYLKSPVIQQFGDEIKEIIKETVKKLEVKNATIRAIDKGALNCTIEARVICALMRAMETETIMWEDLLHG